MAEPARCLEAQREKGSFHGSHLQVLLIQAGSLERLIAAARAVCELYPSAVCIGWLRAEDLIQGRASGLFSSVEVIPSRMDPPQDLIGDLCILSFEDRFGAGYWTLRNIPLRSGIRRIAFYNRSRRLREFSRFGWRANTIAACFVLYPVFLCIRTLRAAWHHTCRYIDIVVLFALAGLAFLARCMWSVCGRSRRMVSSRSTPQTTQRVVLFIPSLGMGGAQRQLLSYLRHIDRNRWQPEIVTIDTVDTFFVTEFASLGVPVTFFTSTFRLSHVGVVWQLVRFLHGLNMPYCIAGFIMQLRLAPSREGLPGCLLLSDLSEVNGLDGSLGSIRSGRGPLMF